MSEPSDEWPDGQKRESMSEQSERMARAAEAGIDE